MENIDKWKKAGKIAGEALEYGRSLIIKGASYLEVTEKVEAKIRELGGEPAFPAQMSLNEVAAHFTVDPEQDINLDGHLVCLDVGVHVDGCIGDTACTVDLSGNHAQLVEASREALNNAIKAIESGERKLGKIGGIIDETIQGYGFRPIKNLSGHGLGEYDVHTTPSIPNYDTGDEDELENDSIFAIEPFATDGSGIVYEVESSNIFSQVSNNPVRSAISREILREIVKYEGLPFTTRWLAKKFPLFKVNFALKEMLKAGTIRSYPALPDKNKGLVSQAEHTLYIDKDGKVEVLTRI